MAVYILELVVNHKDGGLNLGVKRTWPISKSICDIVCLKGKISKTSIYENLSCDVSVSIHVSLVQ